MITHKDPSGSNSLMFTCSSLALLLPLKSSRPMLIAERACIPTFPKKAGIWRV